MRRFIALLAPCILLTACSSKQLTERSARSLISDNVSSHPYLVSLAPIAPLMNRTLVDYSATPVAGNDATRILHTLIELKDVVSKVETVSYPKITGTFIK